MLNSNLPGPKFVQLMQPVLIALRELGGSARPAEVADHVAEALGITEEERAELIPSGAPRFDHLVAWSRFYLAKAGYIDSSRRGVWTLTDRGRAAGPLDHEAALRLFRQIHSGFKSEDDESTVDDATPPEPDAEVPSSADHRGEVITLLQALPPAGFERFCQRLLREAGFQEVTVTGRPGDGGIDGIGVLEINALVSFKVLFQCKRYASPISTSHVRDFRGAMMGRADKGIILTTSTFTPDARREAVRDGAPPIELVDGDKLVRMLEDLELGLVPVQSYRVDRGFFDDFTE
ncbi:MAG: restriction endonuclease [Sandaracinaceae bacterium]|nr:restriction endonuclease [Sandaracinaceae bacterium]